ncbi:MAG: ABC transporter ATP-binding protein [Candidatus Nanoarchaeia archaeon]|nr:ABC transporter ATP-binding protein [Candidatus Nanoarchaeia archaeon]
MEKEAVIEVRDLRKTYYLGQTKVHALRGVDFKIYKGDFVSIVGPSGCGKSTIMHILGLLDTPTSGDIFINGQKASDLSDEELTFLRNKNIGFVFQFFFLSPYLSAVENVQLPMIFSNKSENERKKKAEELLKKTGLSDRMHHLPNQLSGGQRQRVAIARALSNNPTLILADEPTGNLDSETGREILEVFKELWNQGNTVVIVTHDEYVAKKAKRIFRMLDGKIISEVKGEELDRKVIKELDTQNHKKKKGVK